VPLLLAGLVGLAVGRLEIQKYPKEWGELPSFGTMDYRILPGGYGHGSSTLASWIETNMRKKTEKGRSMFPPAFGEPPRVETRDYRPLPFGYGFGSSTMAQWLERKAQEVYGASVQEYDEWYKAAEEEPNDSKPVPSPAPVKEEPISMDDLRAPLLKGLVEDQE